MWRVKLNLRGNKVDPKIDYPVWRFWFDMGQYIVAFFVALYIRSSNRDKAQSKDLDAVKESTLKDFKEVENRITKLETGTISHDDLGKVYDRINEVSDQVSNLSGKMDGLRGAVDMIQEYLLNNGGKK